MWKVEISDVRTRLDSYLYQIKAKRGIRVCLTTPSTKPMFGAYHAAGVEYYYAHETNKYLILDRPSGNWIFNSESVCEISTVECSVS